MPKVSVIIPVYGVEKYIDRCARSLFEQTLDDIEYLFIDDCTPDKSVEVLKRVLEEYPNRKEQVIIHRMEQNSGQAAVRKWGLQNATGEYVIHCDSDDWVDADMYRAMYMMAVEENSDAVICDSYSEKGDERIIMPGILGTTLKDEIISDILRQRISSALWNKLIKRSVYTCHYIEYPDHNMGEDLLLIVQALGFSENISYIRKPFYYYFINENSIVHAQDKIYKNFVDICSNVAKASKYLETYHPNKYTDEIIALKSIKRDFVIPIIQNKKIYTEWKSTFPEINKDVLWCKQIPLKERIRFVLVYTKIWNILKR